MGSLGVSLLLKKPTSVFLSSSQAREEVICFEKGTFGIASARQRSMGRCIIWGCFSHVQRPLHHSISIHLHTASTPNPKYTQLCGMMRTDIQVHIGGIMGLMAIMVTLYMCENNKCIRGVSKEIKPCWTPTTQNSFVSLATHCEKIRIVSGT